MDSCNASSGTLSKTNTCLHVSTPSTVTAIDIIIIRKNIEFITSLQLSLFFFPLYCAINTVPPKVIPIHIEFIIKHSIEVLLIAMTPLLPIILPTITISAIL